MLSVQRFRQKRQNYLKEYQRLRSATDHNFLLCSNKYAEKLRELSRPTTRPSTSNANLERTRTLLILTRVQPSVPLNNNNNNNNNLSTSNIRVTNWNPQQSRITRENKDYMTALAKGLTRDDGKQISNENNEMFSSRWHHHLSNNVHRPGTAKQGLKGSRSAPERAKMSFSTLIEVNRPTTAPVIIEERPRRTNTDKIKSAAPIRPPPPAPPPAPLGAPRLIDSSGNFDNLTSSTFFNLTDGLKPSILKNDNHFVHQICSATNDTTTEQLNTSRDSFLDLSNGNLLGGTTNEKQQLNETVGSDQDETKTDDPPDASDNVGVWYRDSRSGRIEAMANLPSRTTPREDPKEVERRIIEQEQVDSCQRQKDIEEFLFDLKVNSSISSYDYKNPFADEYDEAITLQAQLQTNATNSEWNLKDFYRDVKTKFEQDTNTKAIFEKCIKLARLQASTIKWEQRRRQNINTYNRLMRNNALDASMTNLAGNLSAKNNNNNNNNSEKENRELNELKRDLRCNECKRITCLGNCAPGQDYHLYKRIVSSVPAQSSSARQPSVSSGTNIRDQHRCKHGCTTCSTSNCRTTADVINANGTITSLNNNNNNNHNHNRLRSSKATFSYGQKCLRPTVDLRPRSMHQVTREMKIKFEQANLSPVVVVPLFEDESQSILTTRSRKKSPNGLLPGKSFRSQRRDSLTVVPPQKILS